MPLLTWSKSVSENSTSMPEADVPSPSPVAVWTATAAGLGRLRPAPGTWGSLPALFFAWPVLVLTDGWWTSAICATLALVVALLGWWVVPAAGRAFDRDDPGEVVIDEVAGLLATYACLPWWNATILQADWLILVAGFVVFRLFDILKPWPISACDAWHGVHGIMADDLVAGLLAALVLAPWLV